MKQTSLFLEFIGLQANDLILEDKGDLYPKLKAAVEEGKEMFELLGRSDFNLNLHINASNRHSATNSTGCGCAFCAKRHTYSKFKLTLHRKKKAFESFYEQDDVYGQEAYSQFKEEKEQLSKRIKEERQQLYKIKAALNALGFDNNVIV